MHRPTIGIIALVLLLTAAALLPTSGQEAEVWRAGCLRVGLLMAALWLAHPHLKGISPRWVFFGIGLGVVILIVSFKHPLHSILAAAALLLAYMFVKSRAPEKPRKRTRQI